MMPGMMRAKPRLTGMEGGNGQQIPRMTGTRLDVVAIPTISGGHGAPVLPGLFLLVGFSLVLGQMLFSYCVAAGLL